MVLKVKWSEPALDDLDEALKYIAFDNPDAARELV
jgi:plasmid stabilization system protein ParE